MNYGFLINLVHGVKNILTSHGSDTNEVWISINRDNPKKVQFIGMFHATPEFLSELVDLCSKHFNKEEKI